MLTVRVLGEQSLADATTGARVASARGVSLVAHLALHAGVPQPRALVAEQFWPNSSSAQALTNLRRELHQLRPMLPVSALDVTATKLTWHDTADCVVDLRTFAREREAALAPEAPPAVVQRHGRAAVAAYGGDFLPGGYEPWALDARDTLHRQCLELLDRLAEAARTLGDVAGAVEAARRAVAMAPLEESRYLALMQLQAGLGDRAAALDTYRRCAETLDRELGVSPGRQLRAELARLSDPASADRRPERPGEAVLVGRARELSVLTACWERVATEGAAVAVVRGHPGVGKTRLAAEVLAAAGADGAVTAFASCLGTTGRVALAPVADWLRAPDVSPALARLEDVWRAEVARLLPDGSTPPVRVDRPLVDAWQRHRFFEGLARALLGSDRPTLLMLDNLQWSDEETLSFLAFLLRLGHDRPLMLLATVRDGYPAAVADWLAQLRSAGTIGASISLEPLGRADCAALVRALAGRQADPATVDALVSVAGGFPLYVREAVRSGLESADAAAGWNDLLAMRLDQLSETGQQVAALTAAAGREVTLDLLTVAAALDAGPDAEAVVRAVDELWHAGILTANGTGYDFSHDLLRDAAYDAVTPARRWLLHDRLARALEALGSDAPDVAAQLAEQYARGGRPERALPHFARAIAGATDRFAHTEAIRLCRRALDLVATLPAGPTRDASELSFLRVQAAPLNAVEGYSSPALEQVLERVVRLAESARDDTSLAEGLMGLWACRFVQGQVERSFGLAHRLLELGVGDPALTAEAHFATAGSAMTLGQLRTSLAHFDKARRDPAEDDWLLVGTKPEWHRMAWSAHALLLSGDPIGAEKARSTAIEQSAAVGHPYTLAVTYGYAAVTDQLRGDRAALAVSVRALLELTERYHFAYYHEWGQLLHGWLVGGADGLAEARRGLETLRRHGALVRMPYWLSLVADLHLAAGRRDAAAAALDAARSYALGRGDRWWLPEVLRRLGRLRADDETYAAGRALADEQGNRLSLDRYAGDELVER